MKQVKREPQANSVAIKGHFKIWTTENLQRQLLNHFKYGALFGDF